MTTLEIPEYDEAGNLVNTFVETSPAGNPHIRRIDLVRPENGKTLPQKFLDIFLPAGYPQSVTDDYLEYQIFDSLQAFSSSIAGLLANRAVLEGVGVGNASTTPTAALLLTILQETTGRLATIFFAHRLGTSLEPECKMYRLAADVFNDCAMILDCLNPALPSGLRIGAMCGAGVMRAICGVAAGSSKASLSKHFARWGNLGELNAKDSSQETVISLIGTLTGSLVIPHITSPTAVWATLLCLLTIHLSTNALAVRAVRLRTLNRQRANLVFSHLVSARGSGDGDGDDDNDAWREAGADRKGPMLRVPTPAEISTQERIFCLPGSRLFFRASTGQTTALGTGWIGVSLSQVVAVLTSDAAASRRPKTGSVVTQASKERQRPSLADLTAVFKREQYMVWFDGSSRSALVVLKRGASAEVALKAWLHGYLLAMETRMTTSQGRRPWVNEGEKRFGDSGVTSKQDRHQQQQTPLLGGGAGEQEPLARLRSTLGKVNALWMQYADALKLAGWDLEEGALETRSGVRAAW